MSTRKKIVQHGKLKRIPSWCLLDISIIRMWRVWIQDKMGGRGHPLHSPNLQSSRFVGLSLPIRSELKQVSACIVCHTHFSYREHFIGERQFRTILVLTASLPEKHVHISVFTNASPLFSVLSGFLDYRCALYLYARAVFVCSDYSIYGPTQHDSWLYEEP